MGKDTEGQALRRASQKGFLEDVSQTEGGFLQSLGVPYPQASSCPTQM